MKGEMTVVSTLTLPQGLNSGMTFTISVNFAGTTRTNRNNGARNGSNLPNVSQRKPIDNDLKIE